MNGFKQKLSHGGAVGTFAVIGSMQLAQVIAGVGFDFVLVDMEHGLIGIETAAAMFAAIARKATPFVRVAGADQAIIKRALDAGAEGIMVPMLRTAEEVAQAVACVKYPPEGSRGAGAGAASEFGVGLAGYIKTANENITVAIQIENVDALNNIEKILAVPGVDVAFVGPTDLSMSMGVADKTHPRVEEGIEKVLRAAQAHGIAPGIFCFEEKEAAKRIAQGFRFVAVGLDSIFAFGAARAALEHIQKERA